MSEETAILDEARSYCDPATGEVLQRIPEALMKRLRAAKLARGIPRQRSEHTDSHATWFVFLNDEIRERILAEWRNANRGRKRKRRKRQASSVLPSEHAEARSPAKAPERGLLSFVKRGKHRN